jgi:hypothetical protein
MPENEVELARQEGGEFRSVQLQLQADGGIRLHAYDKGAKATLTLGHEDYEFWVTIPPEAVGRLAFVLMRERFDGRLQAVTEFRDFCKSHEIVNEFDART